jgi:hypothetical protein
MKTLAPLADRLATFIRLLTLSIRDAEVAAACAIVRTLQDAGGDIHDLTESIGATSANGKKFTEADACEIYERGIAAGRPAAEQTQSDDGAPWHAIAYECVAHPDGLRDKREKVFVADMVRWTTRGSQPTEKQAKWLHSIYVRVR